MRRRVGFECLTYSCVFPVPAGFEFVQKLLSTVQITILSTVLLCCISQFTDVLQHKAVTFNLWIWNGTTNLWNMRHLGMYTYQSIFQNSAKFFLLFQDPSLPLSVSCGVAWSLLYMSIGSLSLAWLWLCGPALCLFLTVCLQLPSGSICLVLVPWFP